MSTSGSTSMNDRPVGQKPTPPPHTIEVISGDQKDALEDCFKVRIDVFHHEQGFPLDAELDDLEQLSTHILLRAQGIPAGTIRGTFIPTYGKYKLSRLAVLSKYRSYGWGGTLVHALHEWVKSDATIRGIIDPEVVCHSQLPVKTFYARYGYQSEGDEFDQEGAPHQKMVAHLQTSQ